MANLQDIVSRQSVVATTTPNNNKKTSRMIRKIPPVAVMLLVTFIMMVIWHYTPTMDIPVIVRLGIIIPICIIGAYAALASVWEFKKAKTTVNPFTPEKASSLVTSGVYRISRNPMYLALLCYLIALTIYLASPFAILGPIYFIWHMNQHQIAPEEAAMTELFGNDFEEYKFRVRRWI